MCSNRRWLVSAALCSTMLLTLLTGCAKRHLYVAVDVSGSTAHCREAQVKLCLHLAEFASADSLSLWRFAREAHKLWEGPAMSISAAQLKPVAEKALRSEAGPGTYPRRLLEALAADVARRKEKKDEVYVVLLWDGENTPGEPLAPLARRLAETVRALWIAGVPPEARVAVERQFEPFFGDRLVVSGIDDQEAAYVIFCKQM